MPDFAASPFLLAVECATRTASVALVRGGELLGTRTSDPGQHHAESLLAMIASLLEAEGAKAADLDTFAVGVGPGAFTSIRIGVATIKGLAFESTQPVAAVSTLEAVAHASFAAHADLHRVIAVLDARRGRVYAGEFERAASSKAEAPAVPVRVGELALRSTSDLAEEAPKGAGVAGELPPRFAESLAAAGREDLRVLPPATAPRAISVAQLGLAELAAGRSVLASELAPRYLQRPEAEETRLAAESRASGGAGA